MFWFKKTQCTENRRNGGLSRIKEEDAQPAVDAPPAVDALPAVDSPPAVDAPSTVGSPRAVDEPPTVDAQPGVDALPTVDFPPTLEAQPAMDALDTPPALDFLPAHGVENMKIEISSLKVNSWAESNPLTGHTVISLITVTVQCCVYLESEKVDIGNEMND